jgi:hypothetical protein
LEGSDYVLIKEPFQHLPGGADKNDKKLKPGYLISQPGFEPSSPKIEV